MAKQTEEQKAAATAKRAATNAAKKAQEQTKVAETEEQKAADDQASEDVETVTQEEADALIASGEAQIPEEALVENGKVRVLPLVNIICLDGTHLEIGKHAFISEPEYERLKDDARGPFFKE